MVHVVIPETPGTATGQYIFHTPGFFLVNIQLFLIINLVDGIRIFNPFKMNVNYGIKVTYKICMDQVLNNTVRPF